MANKEFKVKHGLVVNGSATVDGGLRSVGTVVGSLPTAVGVTGMIYTVTDATTPVIGSVVSGGGSTFALVVSNGTNWVVASTVVSGGFVSGASSLSVVGQIPSVTSPGVLGGSTSLAYNTSVNTATGASSIQIALTDGGLSRMVKTRPRSESKRIVIYGSSVAAGAGASTYNNSWAGKFTTAMTAKGYTVINASISGNSTANLISRFWTDVAPLLPDFVVLCSGFPNDGYDQTQYINNIHRLSNMVRSIDAAPVIFGQYGDNSVDATILVKKREMYQYFDKLGIQIADMFGSVTDPATGYWLTGTFSDSLHPNDTGHGIMYDCIPLTWFDNYNINTVSERPRGDGYWTLSSSSVALRPIDVTLDRPAPSWTAAAWIRDGGYLGRAYLSVANPEANINRLRNPAGVYDFSTGGLSIITTTPASLKEWHHVAVTYQKQTGITCLYIDGILAASGTETVPYTASAFSWLGRYENNTVNANEASIANALVYRTALTANDIRILYSGNIITRSLEWGYNFNQIPTSKPRNLADTATVTTLVAPTDFSGPFIFNRGGMTLETFTSITITANYTVPSESDYTILADTTSTNITLTLPTAPRKGKIFVIKKIAAGNTLTVTTVAGGFAIEGAITQVLTFPNEVLTLYFDGLIYRDIGKISSSKLIDTSLIVRNNQTNTYTIGSKQIFGSSATTSGIGFVGVSVDPSSVSAGDMWYRSDLGTFGFRNASAVSALVAGGRALTTAGAIPYVTSTGVLGQDASNLFWDSANARLGVGTNAPSYQLHVRGSAIQQLSVESTGNAAVVRLAGNAYGQFLSTIGAFYLSNTASAQPIVFENGGSEAMRIAATTRNLLLGTSTDDTVNKLQMTVPGGSGIAMTSTGSIISTVTPGGGGAFAQNNASGTGFYWRKNGVDQMWLDSSGYLTLRNQVAITGATQLIVQAGPGQSSTNLQTWQNSGGTVLAAITSGGAINAADVYGTSDTFWLRSAVSFFDLQSGFVQRWSSTSSQGGTKDLSLSRASANTLQIGDGGSNANGSLVAANMQFNNFLTVGATGAVIRFWGGATHDASISRSAANILQIGDGGANANGTIVAKILRTSADSTGLVVDIAGSSRIGFYKYAGLEGALVRTALIPLRFGRVSDTDITVSTSGTFTEEARFAPTTGNFLIGTTTDDTVNKLQVSGGVKTIGSLAGLIIGRRDTNASAWQFYSQAGQLALFSYPNNGDVFEVNGTTTVNFNFFNKLVTTGNTTVNIGTDGTSASAVANQLIIRAGGGQSSTNLMTWQNNAGTATGLISADGSVLVRGAYLAIQNAVGSLSFGGFDSNGLRLASNRNFAFSSTTDAFGSIDTGIARNAAGIAEINNGTPTSYRSLYLQSVRPVGSTVAALPAAAAGMIATVTDATATTIGTTVAGGGANTVQVWYNGTNWRISAN